MRHALERLAALLDDFRAASLYESEPLEGAGPFAFLNTVASGRTCLAPRDLLARTQAIERSLGRSRSPDGRKTPRTIDIDLLLYGQEILEDAAVTLPHPRMHLRRFVLVPLLEISPALRDPRSGLPYRSYLDALGDQTVVLFRSEAG